MSKSFDNQIIMLGFGCIGKALLPLLIIELKVKPQQITIITMDDLSIEVAHNYGVNLQIGTITNQNYLDIIGNRLQQDDLVVDVSTTISSVDIILLCEQKSALYVNTSIERWGEAFILEKITSESRTNYSLRQELIDLKGKTKKTAVLTHGANPGLVSHFIKQALINLAQDNGLDFQKPKTQSEWAKLTQLLGIKTIHIAEHDTQNALPFKAIDEFVNTWSIQGFLEEIRQPVEIGWGNHEKHIPLYAKDHSRGSKCTLYIERPSASFRVRSWTPSFGSYLGFLITHSETTSITEYLTVKQGAKVQYRPTVLYAYCPCPDAILSIHELAGNEWIPQKNQRLIVDTVAQGSDEMGVLLMGNPKGAYWFGSTLSIEQARKLVPHNNATSLQVVAGLFAAIVWIIQNPNKGIVEPEELDYEQIMKVASPYLGTVAGYYTDWTPLHNRERLYQEIVDADDPWQFINMLVD